MFTESTLFKGSSPPHKYTSVGGERVCVRSKQCKVFDGAQPMELCCCEAKHHKRKYHPNGTTNFYSIPSINSKRKNDGKVFFFVDSFTFPSHWHRFLPLWFFNIHIHTQKNIYCVVCSPWWLCLRRHYIFFFILAFLPLSVSVYIIIIIISVDVVVTVAVIVYGFIVAWI